MEISDTNSFGERIRMARKRLKVTQKDLSLASGIGLRFIIELEKGKPTCQIGKALELARALGLKMEMTEP